MINNTRRIGIAFVIDTVAFVIAALNATEFHEDIVINGDPVIVAFGEADICMAHELQNSYTLV